MTTMQEAFGRAGLYRGKPQKDPDERLYELMEEAIRRHPGNADAACKMFAEKLLEEDDARLVWHLVLEVRMTAVRRLHGMALHRVRNEIRSAQGGDHLVSDSRVERDRSRAAEPDREGGGHVNVEPQAEYAPASPDPGSREGGRVPSDIHNTGATLPAASSAVPAIIRPLAPVSPQVLEVMRLGKQSLLDELKTRTGRAYGSLRPSELEREAEADERRGRFLRLLREAIGMVMPGDDRVTADFITAEDADKIWKLAGSAANA